ncbi:aldehyde dehydrogenase domain-containing protein [Fusarium oxysporum Fo47]|uniref:Succinate-semialdehyde dehydrogenase, mitochondrial n=1 Tax=Fusarium oxysporum Fo47 TaxID=660027 RepID=W9J8N1_FUSOX|nr:aldehyde dehydrogenase domain-containing protein [Fusarium oxysporum Fo47]EWZ28392.1 succinate-semialdehyde dehydrogenase (NADP+) [Fusarium oxysporum Fo47]WJG35654.1 aldehyde dehydrogenase domain-containing protein [Fusarium oxysporum Fo47]
MASLASQAARFGCKLNDASLLTTQGFIDGQWQDAPSGESFPVYEPASATVLSNCSSFSRRDIIRAITSANKAQKRFHALTTASKRGVLLRKWNDLILHNSDDLAQILMLENGKTFEEAKNEIIYAASYVAWFAEEATRSYGDIIPSSIPGATLFTVKEPIGVCGIITPWNFPAAMITRKVAPALAAGCSVVVKPPSETPFTALALTRLAMKAGIPPDCIQVVPTRDRSAASELASNPLVRKLSFTGSTNVGKMLAGLASKTMKKLSMELGGNAAFIVFEDADLDLAVEGAMKAKFRASGQTCVCANRLFVHASVVDEFCKCLAEKVAQLKLGFGLHQGVTQGPLINKSALEKVAWHVQDALNLGGELVFGGKRPAELGDGYFFQPTIIKNATMVMAVARDETFGPLAAVFSFNSEQEVIQLANSTEFGLAGYFYSRDIHRVFRVAQALEVGMVGVNTGVISAAESPFGGVKESGYGREGSKYGLAEYQVLKSVTVRSGKL